MHCVVKVRMLSLHDLRCLGAVNVGGSFLLVHSTSVTELVQLNTCEPFSAGFCLWLAFNFCQKHKTKKWFRYRYIDISSVVNCNWFVVVVMQALIDYGAYIVDDTGGGNSVALCMESAVNEEMRREYG